MIRILIADDHRIFRQSLRAIIDCEEDMAVVAEAENGKAALKQTKRCRPDVVLMDVNMPIMNGIEATRWISVAFEGIKVIALTINSEDAYMNKMMEAGASSYISKVCKREEIIQGIRAVWRSPEAISLSPRA